MTLRLPWQFEVKAGAIYPLFSEEYGTKSWWHEQYHGNDRFAAVESWRSTELKFTETSTRKFSLPVYFYPFLNGTSAGTTIIPIILTTIRQKTCCFAYNSGVHGFWKSDSVAWIGRRGRWDDDGENDSYQWAAGAEVKFSGFSLSGEYMYRWLQDLPLTAVDERRGR